MLNTIATIKQMLLSKQPLKYKSETVQVPTQFKVIDKNSYKEKTRAEIALNSISDAVICTDIYGQIDYLNIAAEKITGWTKKEAYGRTIEDVFKIINSATRLPTVNPVQRVLDSNEATMLAADTLLIKRDGTEIAIEDSSSPIRDENHQLTGVVIVFHDVSAAKAMKTKMEHLAQHDYLTNLPNRVLLNDRLNQAIEVAKRHDTKLALLFLDLDNFKHINDSLGHETGDKLLQLVTKSINDCLRASDTLSRQGGDEFIILLGDIKFGEDAVLTAEKILDTLSLPHKLSDCELHITTSIGISIYPTDGTTAEELIKNADTAMYVAKENGRNNYQFFKSKMNVRAVERQTLEASLRFALEKNQFLLHYQPKVNLITRQVTGVEALLRWTHDEWGEVLPDRFIPVAEESGLIVPIGRWALLEACKQAKIWQEDGLPNMTMAVNISSKEFMQKNFVSDVSELILTTQIDPTNLELEITESVLMRDAKASKAILSQLKELGLILVVDDFGTGYSSLSYLQQFPIDVLKIDRSFVSAIQSDTDEGAIISAIINMGNSLKLKVIAEGIETQIQLDFLIDRNCQEGQGFFLSKPLTADQFAGLQHNT
jgi:diguanylate cyclase (GGDEF)-like protein/PAS domain S-box-containing protein